jgi:hypothetical protein
MIAKWTCKVAGIILVSVSIREKIEKPSHWIAFGTTRRCLRRHCQPPENQRTLGTHTCSGTPLDE